VASSSLRSEAALVAAWSSLDGVTRAKVLAIARKRMPIRPDGPRSCGVLSGPGVAELRAFLIRVMREGGEDGRGDAMQPREPLQRRQAAGTGGSGLSRADPEGSPSPGPLALVPRNHGGYPQPG
jgi:hypothetical protein